MSSTLCGKLLSTEPSTQPPIGLQKPDGYVKIRSNEFDVRIAAWNNLSVVEWGSSVVNIDCQFDRI